jgi:transcriptional regulator with PAS, ATPase and Fis domain
MKTGADTRSTTLPSKTPMIVGSSRIIDSIRGSAERVARRDAKVLITGESGVGKDVLARYIHAHSSRAHKPFVAVNCAGLTETLLESELFGHVRGSFTGAYRDKPGKLNLANGGTIFLDEVGEMTMRMQALLLRFLESGEIHPVGADTVQTRVDVRVITATNRKLRQLISRGEFREDLFYRIKVIQIHVPPLRERPDDIKTLVEHLTVQHGRSLRFSAEAWQALEAYAWPGNVRELQNVVEQVLWTTDRDDISIEHLPTEIRSARQIGEKPFRERRKQAADRLYDELVAGQYTFWERVHPLFLSRDLTRDDLRQLIRRGLAATNGSYRQLLDLFGMPGSDYKRLLNFLAAHDCAPDYRAFRGEAADSTGSKR